MIEDLLDLWEVACDARCITTNGTIKANGRGVMGRGCAAEAKSKYLGLEIKLGRFLKEYGNHVGILIDPPGKILATTAPLVIFPVKFEWSDKADLHLIVQSARELVTLTACQGWTRVVLPRPGCGNGGRSWEREVRPLLLPILNDRFLVVTK